MWSVPSSNLLVVPRLKEHEHPEADWMQAGLQVDGRLETSDLTISHDVAVLIGQDLERMPARPVFDFLTQFFMSEVNWMSQLLHTPSFMSYYESWWNRRPSFVRPEASSLAIADVDFAVLVLFMCGFATQSLPSPSYLVDKVRGMPLAQIKDICVNVGHSLSAILATLAPMGSIFRVQQICFSGLMSAYEGRMMDSCKMLDSAARMAEGLGYFQIVPVMAEGGSDELECEMRRRALCNLYIWDCIITRQLDCGSLLPDVKKLPGLQILSGTRDSDVSEPFLERLLQARLGAFWKAHRLCHGPNELYDPVKAEETFERFRDEFLCDLPPSYSLKTHGYIQDPQHPQMSMQRQLLHITIFESLCQHFRPLLVIGSERLSSMPGYKRTLIRSQSRSLAHAALSTLEAVSALHSMLGAAHTRSTFIIVPTFEASVILACLCIDSSWVRAGDDDCQPPVTLVRNLSASSNADIGPDDCYLAVQQALARLRMLADVSTVAEVGADHLSRLLQSINESRAAEKDLIADALELGTAHSSWEFNPNLSEATTAVCGTSVPVLLEFPHLSALDGPFRIEEEDHQYND
ncbi:hypothetical protein G7054_g2971 [Neopestalotiopsis clavispora]|nr:hypothetical protein G7054_g2971 [Neopestalotiopsis clavispora]